jgi:hypothetical protein
MAKNEREDNTTAVTKVLRNRHSSDHPIMSFTAVISHQAMAEAFVKELLKTARELVPDHNISAEELLSIMQCALNEHDNHSITMVSGRHLRARVSDTTNRSVFWCSTWIQ